MHILIGLGAAVVLLYFWLIGHWFARVLVFIGLFLIAAALGIATGCSVLPGAQVYGVVVFIGSAIGAWYLASAPILYWRPRIAAAFAASEARDNQLTRETIEQFNRRHGLTVTAPRRD